MAQQQDPEAAFLEAASAPLEAHSSGTLEEAERIRLEHPGVITGSIYAAAVFGEEGAVRACLARDPQGAAAKGGTRNWDALTYLCFSRYLRLRPERSEEFVRTARVLLDSGAAAQTGWIETIDHPNPRPVLESALYGAAGVAGNADLTKLLLERGADPNDEETPYHVPETGSEAVLGVLLGSGTLNPTSLATLLLRLCDWHNVDGVRQALAAGADPNRMTVWGVNALHQAVRRDNSAEILEALLEHGADPSLPDSHGRNAAQMAARRGRAAALALFECHGGPALSGIDRLLAACARDRENEIAAAAPDVKAQVVAHGGTLLAQFAGVGNARGVRHLLALGIPVDTLCREGDGYWGIARDSTALHVAAWRGWPAAVRELLAHGAPVNARDGQGRTPLQLAVKACVDSFWTERRTPESARLLLEVGASRDGIAVPTGYAEIDRFLR